MQSQTRILDDLARVAAGAMSTLSGMRSEVESRLREQLEKVLAGMDLVSRDEFEAVKAMAAKARAEQEDLQKRLAEVESRLASLAPEISLASLLVHRQLRCCDLRAGRGAMIFAIDPDRHRRHPVEGPRRA